jgi:DNA-directed RNA polymerase subunit RPC12/RpoP
VKRRWLIVGGAVLAAALLATSLTLNSSTVTVRAIPITTWAGCSACGHSFKGELTDRPDGCPKCGERAAWPARRCAKCKAIVAIDLDRFNAQKREPYCTKCGSPRLVEIRDDAPGSASGG